MSTITTSQSPVVTVTLDPSYLPGLVYKLASDLTSNAERLKDDVSPDWDVASTLDQARAAARLTATYISILDQIGWQVTEPATVTADAEDLRRIFAPIHGEAHELIASRGYREFYEPDEARRTYGQAERGAADVLAQLDPAGVA